MRYRRVLVDPLFVVCIDNEEVAQKGRIATRH